MNISDKSREELILEIERLLKENEALKAELQKENSTKISSDFEINEKIKNYESFFNSIEDLLFVLDSDGNIIECNNTVYDRLGFTKNELIGQSIIQIHQKEKREEAIKNLNDILEGKTKSCDLPIITKDGIEIPVEIKVYKGKWNGKTSFYGVTKDISQLKLSEEKYFKLYNSSSHIIGLSDIKTGAYFEVNQSFYDILGFTPEEVIGKKSTDVLKLENNSRELIIPKLEKQGFVKNEEVVAYHKNGKEINLLLSGDSIEIAGKKYNLTVAVDITELKQAEKQKNEDRAMLDLVINSVPHSIFWKDRNSIYLGCNKIFAKQVGLNNQNEIVGKNDYDLPWTKNEADAYIADDKEVIESKKSKEHIIEPLQKSDGTRLWIDTSKIPLLDNTGNVFGILGIFSDITERKRQEEELKETYERFVTVMNSINSCIYIADMDTYELLFLNDFGIKTFGKDCIGKKCWQVLQSGQNGPCSFCTNNKLLDNEGNPAGVYHWEFQNSLNKRIYDIQDYAIRWTDGRIVRMEIATDITDRKKAELELKEKELQYNTLADSGFALVWKSGKDKLFNYFNKTWLDFTGRTLEQEINKGWTEGIHPDDFDNCKNTYNTAFENREPFYIEYRLLHNSGEYRWVRDFGTPNYNSSGEFIGYIGHCFDINSLKIAEQKIIESTELLSVFIKNSPVYAYIKEAAPNNSRLIFASDNYKELFGISSEEMIGKSTFDYFPYEEAKKIIEEDWEVVTKRKILKIEDVLNNRNYITIKFPIFLNNKIFLAGYTIDITDQKEMQGNLLEAKKIAEESEEKYKQIFDNTLDHIFIIEVINGDRFKILDVNPIQEKEIGMLTPGKFIEDCFNSELSKYFNDNYKECVAKKTIMIYEEKINNSDFLTQLIPVTNLYGEVYRLIGIARNITNEKKLTNELITQYEKLKVLNKDLILAKDKAEESDKLKTAFLQNISHEIRTPLNGILGFSRLLASKDISNDEINEFILNIDQSGKRLLEIINNVLDISKIETGQIVITEKQFSLNSFITDLFSFFLPVAKQKNIDFNYFIALDEIESYIISDEFKLNQIISNLINNAIKFTEKGTIDFGYKIIDDKYMQFFVKDTGIGIVPEFHSRIFERFSQVDSSITRGYEGAGLGLPICKGLAEKLGGTIWLESEKDKGSTFYVEIPFKPLRKIDSISKSAPDLITNKNQKTILITEDDYVSYKYLKRVLKDFNVILLHAENGKQAVELVRNNPEIDIVLMDIECPLWDGFEATKQIKELRRDLPIIAQTAYAFQTERERILNAGCDEYLSKPIEKDKLINILEKYLN